MGMVLHAATEINAGDSGDTKTIAWNSGIFQKLTVTGAPCVLTFTAPQGCCYLIFKLIQGAGGSKTLTWPGTVKGTQPTLTIAEAATDVVLLYYDGTSYTIMASILNCG